MFNSNEKVRLILLASAFLVSEVILFIIMGTTGETEYIALGTFLTRLIMYIFSLFITLSSYTHDFQELVKYGVSRRTSLIAVTLDTLAVPLILELVFVGTSLLERLLMEKIFGAYDEYKLFELTDIQSFLLGILLVLVIFIMGLLAAVCINKFGHNGMIAVYFIYLILFMLMSQAGSLAKRFTWLGTALTAMLAHPAVTLSALIIVALAACAFMFRSIFKSAV